MIINRFRIKIILKKLLDNILSRRLSDTLYFWFKYQKVRSSNLLFIHIPKAAGSSVANSVYGSRVGHFSASEYVSRIGVSKFNKFNSFSVVRHPYDRFISAFKFARYGGGDNGSINSNIHRLVISYSNINEFVKEWAMTQNVNGDIDILFRCQSSFICDSEGRVLVGQVFKIEDGHLIDKFLSEYFGEPKSIGWVNRSFGNKVGDLTLNEVSKDILYRLYLRDFENFNYER